MPLLANDPKQMAGSQIPKAGTLGAPPPLAPPPKGELQKLAEKKALGIGTDLATDAAVANAPKVSAALGLETTGTGAALKSLLAPSATTAGTGAATTGLAAAAPLFGPAAVGYLGYQAVKGGK